MSQEIVLASGSEIRAALLRNAGVAFDIVKPRLDEDAIKDALLSENAGPRDVADTLAEMKARKVSEKNPEALVIGSDQVLAFDGHLLSKPTSQENAMEQLRSMSGTVHQLYSAAVVYEGGQPVWRFVGKARLSMHTKSDAYLSSYVSRNWQSIRHSVGAYKLEEEGVRLFSRIEGDYFTVLGLPLLELLSYLSLKGALET